MEPTANEKYDLTDGNYQGRMFIVVYRIETTAYEEETGEVENEGDEEGLRDYLIGDLELARWLS